MIIHDCYYYYLFIFIGFSVKFKVINDPMMF